MASYGPPPYTPPSREIVDAEVVSDVPPRQATYATRSPVTVADGQIQFTPPTPDELAMIEQRARAISVYVKLPFYAFVAFSGGVPALLRLTAAVLGVLEATQLARENGYDYREV